MSEAEKLQIENQELRRELRDTRLRLAGAQQILAETRAAGERVVGTASQSLDKAMEDVKFRTEMLLQRAARRGGHRLSWQAIDAIGGFVCKCDPNDAICTVEDLQFFTRDEIAAIPGVGPKTMATLAEVLAEQGLTWKASEQATPSAAATARRRHLVAVA